MRKQLTFATIYRQMRLATPLMCLWLICLLFSCKTESPIPDDVAEKVTPDEVGTALSDFQTYILAESVRKPPLIQTWCRRGVAAAASLAQKNTESTAPVSRRYLDSLQLDMAAVREGVMQPEHVEAEQLIKAGVINLEIKLAHARLRYNWPDLLRVKVNTVRGHKPISGLKVLYLQRGGGRVRLYWRTF